MTRPSTGETDSTTEPPPRQEPSKTPGFSSCSPSRFSEASMAISRVHHAELIPNPLQCTLDGLLGDVERRTKSDGSFAASQCQHAPFEESPVEIFPDFAIGKIECDHQAAPAHSHTPRFFH